MSRGCHSFPHADDRPFLFVVRKNFFLACKQEDKLYMPRGVTLTGSYHCGIAFLIFTRTWHIEQNRKCGNGGTMLKDGNSFFSRDSFRYRKRPVIVRKTSDNDRHCQLCASNPLLVHPFQGEFLLCWRSQMRIASQGNKIADVISYSRPNWPLCIWISIYWNFKLWTIVFRFTTSSSQLLPHPHSQFRISIFHLKQIGLFEFILFKKKGRKALKKLNW